MAPNEGFCNISAIPPEDFLAYPLAIHWDGIAWTEIPPTDDPVYCGVSLQAAGGAASDDIWTALSFHWNGQQWTGYPSHIDDRLSSIQMLSSNDGWDTYGGATWQAWGMGWGRIRHWDGTSWITTRIPTSQGIAKIDMISTTEGWAVGYGGAILHFCGEAPVGKYSYLPMIGKLPSGN